MRRTTGGIEFFQVAPHHWIVAEMANRLAKYSGGDFIGRWEEAVVHPFSLAPRGDDSGPPQVGQMARDLRLAQAKDFDKIADADFAISHQVEQAQARGIGKRAKQ